MNNFSAGTVAELLAGRPESAQTLLAIPLVLVLLVLCAVAAETVRSERIILPGARLLSVSMASLSVLFVATLAARLISIA